MKKQRGDYTTMCHEAVEEFLPAKKILKAAIKDGTERVVVIAIDADNNLTVRSSNRRFSDTITDLLTAQFHMMKLADAYGEARHADTSPAPDAE
jgi:hypothetical protein